MRKVWPEPVIGQTWRDRDKRMSSGNRRVVVTLVAFGDVTYRDLGGRYFQSKVERFKRAFELVSSGETRSTKD